MNDDKGTQPPLKLISSMATRALLAELATAWQAEHPQAPLAIESVGGVDAARRVAAAEAFDGVVLAADAIDRLIASGHVLGPRVDLVRSGVAVAVREGDAPPDIGSEAALQRAVRAARTIGYSTGPSGTQLLALFERWGLIDALRARLVQAPSGTPVGRLVAEGRVELGFQQRSELLGLAGIRIVGDMPEPVQITTVFAAGLATVSARAEEVRALLGWLASPAVAAVKQRHGMEAA
ncbi:MAG TPA: substrate-binding domain-containing protein [Rubrivivax sp.]|nr:substrate-binding domain-containing protein [Burkholderiales bacterium]HNT40155.1 substrate-binding domain-containing protein [Rubrivivax sp.]